MLPYIFIYMQIAQATNESVRLYGYPALPFLPTMYVAESMGIVVGGSL